MNPQESEVLPADEREAIRQRRIWIIIDVTVYALVATGSAISFPLVAHYGLTVGTVTVVVVTFALWVAAFLRLLDVGPGSRTER